MKVTNLFLAVGLLCTLWCTRAGATWTLGGQKSATELAAGDTIALRGASSEEATTGYLLGNYMGSGVSDNFAFVLVAAPNEPVSNAPAFYLKQVTTGKYFGISATKTMAMVDDMSQAYYFSIASAQDSSATNASHTAAWTEKSVCFYHKARLQDGYISVMYLANNFANNALKIWKWKSSNAWDVFTVTNKLDYKTDLQRAVDNYLALATVYTVGEGKYAGETPQNLVSAWETAFANAQTALAETHTDAEYKAIYDELQAARAAVDNGIIQVTTGTYYLISGMGAYYDKQGVQKAMCSGSDRSMRWDTFDSLSLHFMFKLEKQADGNFIIQNLGNGLYLGAGGTNAYGYYFDKSDAEEQAFRSLGSGQWAIHYAQNNDFYGCYHTGGHKSGAGISGTIVTWSAYANGGSAWKFRPVDPKVEADAAAHKDADDLKAAKATLIGNLNTLINKSSNAYNSAFVYDRPMNSETALIKQANDSIESKCQFLTNARDSQKGFREYSSLIDGNYSTFFCTAVNTTGPAEKHYLQIDLSATPQQLFCFRTASRIQTNTERPVSMTLTATNDTTGGGTWQTIRTFDSGLPTAAKDTFYVSPVIDLGASYKYLRFTVNATNNNKLTNGFPYFSYSEFQLYPAKLNESKSQYHYIAGMKDACDALKTAMTAAMAKAADSTATQADIDALQAAYDKVAALYVDTTAFNNLIKKAQAIIPNLKIGTAIGTVPAQSDIDALQTAITTAQGVVLEGIDNAKLTAATEALQSAYDTLTSKIRFIKPGKWYYIKTICPSNTALNGYYLGNPTQCKTTVPKSNNKLTWINSIKNGAFVGTYDPAYMWRFIPKSDGTYSIQNMASGYFIAQTHDISYQYYTSLTPDSDVYTVTYYKDGGFLLRPKGITAMTILAANWQGTPMTYNGWTSANDGTDVYPSKNIRYASMWTFEEVPSDIDAFTFKLLNKNISILTEPFEIVDNVDPATTKFYRICSKQVDAGGVKAIGLKEETNVKAGEPFIIITGDYTKYDASAPDTIDFSFILTDKLATTAKSVNGLVGTMPNITLTKSGMGYFADAVLQVTTEDKVTLGSANLALKQNTGYIDALKIEDTGEDADVMIYLTKDSRLDKIAGLVDNRQAADVYSIDGKLLLRGATPATVKSLHRGLYIVGKKKVFIP